MIRNRRTFKGCSDLPLYNFIKIVMGEHDYLYSESKSILNKNINHISLCNIIVEEYNELLNHNASSKIFSLLKSITRFNNKLSVIQMAVDFLSRKYDKRLCEMLRSMGFRYSFNVDSIRDDLKKTVANAKLIIIKLQEAEKDLENMNKDEKMVTEKDFYALITQLSKYMNFRIDPKNTTVIDFVNYIEAYNSEFKQTQNG